MEQTLEARDWAKQWTAQIGRAVKHYRAAAKLTAEQLAARTDELGYPLTRNVITALETGRKEFVSVQDLSVLALALNVAPALLLHPVRDELAPVVLAPAVPPVDRLAAIEWWNAADPGRGNPVPDADRAWTANNAGLMLLRGHEQGVQDWEAATRQMSTATDEALTAYYANRRADAERQVRATRGQLEQTGTPLPDLPPGLDVSGPFVDPSGRRNLAATYWTPGEL